MKALSELVGEKIMMETLHPLLEAKSNIVWTQLMGVETGGIWVEGTDFAQAIQEKYKEPIPKTPLFFVPFAQIVWIFAVADSPYLSEKSLGLDAP